MSADGGKRLRVGIDVGGTFTHAVAVDPVRFEVVAGIKVPTTHSDENGVAAGIILSLHQLIEEGGFEPSDIAFIAHSTTQATNALLEGDVAPVGILGMGYGTARFIARRETNIEKIEVAPGRYLKTYHRFIDTGYELVEEEIEEHLRSMAGEGAKTFVASESFSIENPEQELKVLQVAKRLGYPATAGHLISQLYGLRIRTRTAVINASMLPIMMETASLTERCVREAGIEAPLMIMRSDGGVMDLEGMRKRPILTMLSGPAAGVAAALMYAKISDGIFLEVGGTSTDISAIRNGKSMVRTAQIGGHRLFIRTLDVRTVGIAGGSVPRVRGRKFIDVGPRSAHIAGVGYASFTEPPEEDWSVSTISPLKDDPDDYLLLSAGDKKITITPTCASNLLGLVEQGDPAQGNKDWIFKAFHEFSPSPKEAAEELLEQASPKVENIVEGLIEDYELDRELLSLVGGGGGASALVPFVAKKMNLEHRISDNNAVISAIGAALAMVRDTIERTVMDPGPEEILKIRREAEESVVRMGASPGSVEVQVEVDPQKNVLRATATGATELKTRELSAKVDWKQVEQMLKSSFRSSSIDKVGDTGLLRIYLADSIDKKLLGLYKRRRRAYRVVDHEGIIRLQIRDGDLVKTDRQAFRGRLTNFLENHTEYGDAGRSIPEMFLVYRSRITDLSGLQNPEQVLSLAETELKDVAPDESVFCLANFR
jgi:N-methylhydantoinase A